jgi:ferric-dicitrate binding protein FerR (iron transport regulator)
MKTRNPVSLGASYPTEIGTEATQWLLRLMDTDPSPDDPYLDTGLRNEAFLDWASRSTQHLAAFLEIYAIYEELGAGDTLARAEIDTLLSKVVSLPAGHNRSPARPQKASHVPDPFSHLKGSWQRAFIFLSFAAGLGAIGIAGWLLSSYARTTSSAITYETNVGERTTVYLDDGSVLILNTSSKVEVTLTWRERRVRLLAGEVLANVHHETFRPFELVTGNVRISDLGTVFDVYRRPDRVRVFVVEGRVRVASAPSGTDAVGLRTGEELEVGSTVQEPHVAQRHLTQREVQDALAWKDGRLSFRDVRLEEAVREINRYNRRQLVISDSRIAGCRVGGTLAISDLEAFIDVIHEAWPVTVLPGDASTSDPNTIRLGLEDTQYVIDGDRGCARRKP